MQLFNNIIINIQMYSFIFIYIKSIYANQRYSSLHMSVSSSTQYVVSERARAAPCCPCRQRARVWHAASVCFSADALHVHVHIHMVSLSRVFCLSAEVCCCFMIVLLLVLTHFSGALVVTRCSLTDECMGLYQSARESHVAVLMQRWNEWKR